MSKLITTVCAIAALVLGVLLFQKFNHKPTPEHALHYQQARIIPSFKLNDHTGKAFTHESLIGKWSWVFFGYTSCPDVCPVTLQELNFVYEDLQAISANNQVLLVSVDPNRDSEEKLAQYIAYFNPEFKALRADHGILFPFARNLGLMYAITDPQDGKDQNYLVDHSASIVLINPAGKIEAIFKPKQVLGEIASVEGDKLVSDFKKIIDLY